MAHRLSQLIVNEVSLVPKGANKKRFALIKSEKGDPDMEELLNAVSQAKLENEDKIDEICKQAKLSDNAIAAVKGALRLLMAVRQELPDVLFRQLSQIAGQSPNNVNGLCKASTLFDLLIEKIKERSDEFNNIAKSLDFTDMEIEKAVNGHFSDLHKDKFMSLFKSLELDTDDILSCVFEELKPEEPGTESVSEAVQKMIDAKNSDLKKSILGNIKKKDQEIVLLQEEIKKLKAAPIAATGEGANGNENINKTKSEKNIWAGIL